MNSASPRFAHMPWDARSNEGMHCVALAADANKRRVGGSAGCCRGGSRGFCFDSDHLAVDGTPCQKINFIRIGPERWRSGMRPSRRQACRPIQKQRRNVPRHDHGGSEPLLQTQPTMHHWYPEPLTFEVTKHEADKQCGRPSDLPDSRSVEQTVYRGDAPGPGEIGVANGSEFSVLRFPAR